MQLSNLTNLINALTRIGEFCLLIGPTREKNKVRENIFTKKVI
jgi:hypothetical protein